MSEHGSTATNSRLLACQQCDKRFTRPENLARHMKTHASIRNHSCQICGRKFTRSDLRKKHELLHERATPARAVSKARRATRSTSTRIDTPSPHIAADLANLSYFDDQGVTLSMGGGNADVISQEQSQTTLLDRNFLHESWSDQVALDPYFDYTTFARPWNHPVDHAAESSDWFSSQFFAALRETELAYSPPNQTWSTTNYDLTSTNIFSTLDDNRNARLLSTYVLEEGTHSRPTTERVLRDTEPNPRMPASMNTRSDQISRIASPPNESSNEDRLPFAWDPRSRPIAKAKPIILADDDPIFGSIDQSLQITQATLSRIQDFLRPKERLHGEDTFTLPSLSLAKVFISLFFNRFLPQAPTLHRPTLIVEALPPPLLTIIMVIGSCYSRLRNTRRFGIMLFDRTRQNLLAMIEEDNKLMREPMVIYAVALVCYMGLWCGNKRAFELSEALRAVAVTYIRRLPNANDHHQYGISDGCASNADGNANSTTRSKPTPTVDSQWRDWIAQESRKRLRWFVYMIDAQFPSILGMSSMFTAADVRKWECPCDEGFWTVTTAKSWRNRLGSASEPACSVFGSLLALTFSTRESAAQGPDEVLLPNINVWSAGLLLTAIMAEVFHYQDTFVVLRTYEEDTTMPTDSLRQDDRAEHLRAMLEAWDKSYRHLGPPRLETTTAYLSRCSIIMYYLARLYLVFPISEIQDCLGKSGPTSARAAMTRLSSWIAQDPEEASRVMEHASTCISVVMSNEGESGPYDIIGLFLCHVIIWSFAHTLPELQKEEMVQILRDDETISRSLLEVVEAGFASDNTDGTRSSDAPQLIFKYAIQSLVQLGDWGASSNLALLLHLHPGIGSC